LTTIREVIQPSIKVEKCRKQHLHIETGMGSAGKRLGMGWWNLFTFRYSLAASRRQRKMWEINLPKCQADWFASHN